MLKIEDVKAGDKYQLTTPALKGFVLNAIYTIEKIVGKYIKFKNTTDPMYFENLVYFKKVEQSQQYTFDDLIDYAVQAFKDGKLFSVGITVCGVSARLPDKQSEILFINTEVKRGMEYIQSLYKETFVIESEDDIKRIRVDAIVTLANEIKVYAKEVSDNWINAPLIDSLLCNSLNYVSLKGATVEQERGRDD